MSNSSRWGWKSASALVVWMALAGSADARTLHVPGDFADIQPAIDAADSGDVVLVGPGRYIGPLEIRDKHVALRSSGGPAVTELAGGGDYTLNLSYGGEVSGFAIRNPFGGAIRCYGTGPIVRGNIIEGNRESSNTFAPGIAGPTTDALVDGNVFRRNKCFQSSLAQFYNLGYNGMAPPRIVNNLFIDNDCQALQSGGPIIIAHNTFVGNRVGFYEFYAGPALVLRSNIFAANGIGLSLHLYLFGEPTVERNLVFGNDQDWGEYIPPAGAENLLVAPEFVDIEARDLRLRPGSPAIDAALADPALDHDFAGLARPLDGDGDSIAAADIGAYELPPPGLSTYTPTPTPSVRPTASSTPTHEEPSPFGPFPPGATVFVDVANPGPADGSRHHPYRTIQAAIDSASDAAVVGVAAGTYQEAIVMKRRMEVHGSGADRTVIDAGGTAPAVRCADQTVIEGFTITGASGRGAAAIECGALTTVTIARNRITGNDCVGVRTNRATVVIVDNEIDGNRQLTRSCPCDAVVLSESDATVRKNRLNAADPSGNISAVNVSGYYFEIEQNYVTGRMWIRGVVPPPQPGSNQVRNNLIVGGNTFSSGINVASSNDPVLIANNTLVGGGGIFLQGRAPVEIVNNIVAFGKTGITVFRDDPESVLLRNNLVFGNSIDGRDRNYEGVPDPTGKDGNLSREPGFVDPTGGNYHLTCRSPAIEAGDPSEAPEVDLDDQARPFDADGDDSALPDVGAYEYVAPRSMMTLRVPGDFATPREALEQALPCDVVEVAPGTYAGSVRFAGKDVDVHSVGGAPRTRIEGTGGPAVDIGPGGELRGFTVYNSANPGGVGAEVHGAGARLLENVFDGRGAQFSGIIGDATAQPYIERNILRGSQCPAGGGVIDLGGGSASVESNLIVENDCDAVITGGGRPRIVNNTIVKNRTGIDASRGPVLNTPIAVNNLIITNEVGIRADLGVMGPDLRWQHNLLFANGQNYVGIPDQTGVLGNQQDDPRFVDATRGDYHLRVDSPAVDAGLTSFAPDRDLDGTERPLDGSGDGLAAVDIGAYEFEPAIACLGDCNADRQVTVDELVKGVNIVLGAEALNDCAGLDENRDGKATVDELVRAVINALSSCPQVARAD